MTLYTYASNAAALREAAGHEAQSLAGDLTQRMQLVTTQISERVEHLMDVQRETDGGTATAAQPTAAVPPRQAEGSPETRGGSASAGGDDGSRPGPGLAWRRRSVKSP